MKFSLVIVLVLVVAVMAEHDFDDFRRRNRKQYKSAEEATLRKGVFLKNCEAVDNHNKKFEKGLVSYRLEVNQFADMLKSEFLKGHGGVVPPPKDQPKFPGALNASDPLVKSNRNVKAPASMDWRARGAVTPVKDQRDCGSCWAFSGVGAVESFNFIKTGRLTVLSEQNAVDCAKENYGSFGCEGGGMPGVFEYTRDNKGINTGKSYPYEARDDRGCRFNKLTVGARVSGYVGIDNRDENAMKEALANNGPLAVAVHVSDKMMAYAGGVFSEAGCSTEIDHGVLIVGYGTENGKDFWLVKNSWGTGWGDKGYFKIERGVNMCGIAEWPSYPV